MELPFLIKVKQRFESSIIRNLQTEIRNQWYRLRKNLALKTGASVAVAIGSRGIANLDTIVRLTINEIKALKAKPFIFPAMGSHGGGTAEGQRKVLKELGITEESIGAPIRATMEVQEIGETKGGLTIYMDQYAYDADKIVIVNRIKPHTDFDGNIESGLMKMILIGLGKQKGADYYHRVFLSRGCEDVILEGAREIINTGRILFGIGIVENERDETSIIRFVLPQEIEQVEKELLVKAKAMFPALPFDEIDILIVDEMGKEISGAGMDPNVTCRRLIRYKKAPGKTDICRIFVRDLTDSSHGNAAGIGAADFTTKRLVEKIDFKTTYINCITGCGPEEARIPITLETDEDALEACFSTIRPVRPQDARIIYIKNTLEINEFYASEAFREEIESNANLEIVNESYDFCFDKGGNISSPFVVSSK